MSEWSEAENFRLRELWADKSLSGTQIGRLLGKSKNSVVGRAHRLGLKGRVSPIQPKGSGKAPRNRPMRVAAGVPTLAPLTRFCAHCGGELRPQQEKFCKPQCLHDSQRRQHAPKPKPAVEAPQTVFKPLPSSPCCWPIGMPGTRGFRYCDEPSRPGKPYCDEHYRIAYVRRADLREAA